MVLCFIRDLALGFYALLMDVGTLVLCFITDLAVGFYARFMDAGLRYYAFVIDHLSLRVLCAIYGFRTWVLRSVTEVKHSHFPPKSLVTSVPYGR